MRTVNLELDAERLAFAREAAEWFKKDPAMRTYTNGPIEPGKWFAVRWGADEDCVVVFKLDDFAEVVKFDNIVERS